MDDEKGKHSMNETRITAELLKRPVAYHPILAKAFGSVNLALLWSQFYYWSERTTDPEGWVYKTQNDIFDETGIMRRKQEGARILGKSLGVLEEKLEGAPAQLYYRVNVPKAVEVIESYMQKGKTPTLFPSVSKDEKTPGEIATMFFTGDQEIIRELMEEILGKSEGRLQKDVLTRELGKFVSYWTEPNKTGRKVRWEGEPTFEIRRRIYTWLSRATGYEQARTSRKGVTV